MTALLSVDRPDLPAVLAAALTSRTPDAPLPPGPRANRWPEAAGGDPPPGATGLLDALWRPCGFHRAADGALTGIRRRPVPSAGGCYPVQTHLVARGGGLWVFDHEARMLRRRDPHADTASGWAASLTSGDALRLVFTVQPGRSFGRYRHRSWPLWIADVAYALAAVRFLLGERAGAVELGPSTRLRRLLGMPRAADAERWISRGLAPEIPLASIEIDGDPAPLSAPRRALAARRSPSLQQFAARAHAVTPSAEAERLARGSGQAWVRGATSTASWSIPVATSAPTLAASIWDAHLSAAALCYAAALSGERGARAVSGFPALGGRWIIHAVAFLDHGGPR